MAGAVSGQLSQALASFVLQALAARILGASGLGVFALLYGGIVLGTAVVSGFVGDSLTVLDRANAPIRAALQNWCALLSVAGGGIAAVASVATGLVHGWTAVFFGLATTAFIVEDSLRRLLMASMRFWALPVLDTVALVASLVVLAVEAARPGPLGLSDFMLALLVGQLAGGVAAAAQLPSVERRLAALRPAAMAEVARFGRWRGAQQAVRPSMLTGARIVVTVVVSTAAYGQLEAARIYVAPALLVVNGVAAFLLPMYVASRERPVRWALRKADRAAAGLLVTALVLGAAATALTPLLGPIVTGHSFHINALAVFGWTVYAASTATVTPYGGLAAVRGRQARVLGLRLLDSALSLAAALSVLFWLHLSASWVPLALAAGSFLGGGLVRQLVLAPLAREQKVVRRVARHVQVVRT
jgi:O-antigen/teichoic acid export membrane protein